MNDFHDRDERVKILLLNLKDRLPELEKLLAGVSDHWGYEDRVYRFYHQSFKVYEVQLVTISITRMLKSLLPGVPLNRTYNDIVRDGTGEVFRPEHNEKFSEITRPMIEAFLHARFFLEMAVRYGKVLEQEPSPLPSGWAALLYLWNLR